MEDKKKIPTPEAKQPINSPQQGQEPLWNVAWKATNNKEGDLYFQFGNDVIGPIRAPFFKKGTPGKPNPFEAQEVKGPSRTERNPGSPGK